MSKLKEMSPLQKKVFMLLPLGADHSINIQQIQDILGIDKRYIMDIIATLTLEYDIPVGSFRTGNSGYFIATNEKEKIIGTNALKEQALKMRDRVVKVRRANMDNVYHYRNKYADESIERGEQSSIYEYLNKEEEKDCIEA